MLELDPSLQDNNRFSDWLKSLEKSSKEGCGDKEALAKICALAESAMIGDEQMSEKLRLKCSDAGEYLLVEGLYG